MRAGGPRSTISWSAWRVSSRRTLTASRRGVAKDSTSLQARRASASRATSPSRNASASTGKAFGGNSSVPISTRKSARSAMRGLARPGEHRKAQRFAAGVIAFRDAARHVAHAQYEALPFGDRDRVARVQQVEDVRGLEHLLVGGQRQRARQQRGAAGLQLVELAKEDLHVGLLEVVGRHLHLVLVVDVAVADLPQRPVGPAEVEYAVHPPQVHGDAFQPVGDLAGDRTAVQPPDLLEVGELGDLHAVQPDLPPQAPGPQRGRLPVVFDETDVMNPRIDADRPKRVQVERLDLQWRWLDDDLELVVVLQPERVVAIAAVGRPPAGLHIGRAPRFRADGPQERRGMEGPCAHLQVQRLHEHATRVRPEALQPEHQVLECRRGRTDVRRSHGCYRAEKARKYNARAPRAVAGYSGARPRAARTALVRATRARRGREARRARFYSAFCVARRWHGSCNATITRVSLCPPNPGIQSGETGPIASRLGGMT